MKFVILSAILGVLCAHGTNAQTPDCSHFANGALIAHPTIANQYYMCSNGIPIPLTCDTGLVYCSNYRLCLLYCGDAPTNTTTPTTQTTPTTTKVPETTLTPTKAPATTPTPTKAPATTPTTAKVPDTTSTTTKAPSPIPTIGTTKPTIPPTSKPDRCNGLQNGVVFGVDNSCSGYEMCVNNISVPGQCMGGLKFDALKGSCTQEKCP